MISLLTFFARRRIKRGHGSNFYPENPLKPNWLGRLWHRVFGGVTK